MDEGLHIVRRYSGRMTLFAAVREVFLKGYLVMLMGIVMERVRLSEPGLLIVSFHCSVNLVSGIFDNSMLQSIAKIISTDARAFSSVGRADW